jgi:Transposase DDE domain
MMALQRPQSLSISLLLSRVREKFQSITDHRDAAKSRISLTDALMSGLAVFALKFPSLLKFDEQREEKHIRHNLQYLYGVKQAPCDTQLREIIDPVEPAAFHPAFQTLLGCVKDANQLKQFRFLDRAFLVSIDGTGQFSSSSLCCPDCAIKKTRGGETLYYHQLLAAALIHPDRKQVLPLIPEPILRHDGETKNDCEQTAVKRLLIRLREHYPSLPIIVVEDALFAKGPHLNLLKKLNLSYIIGVKEGDHAHLFEAVQRHEDNDTMGGLVQQDSKSKITRLYRFVNGLELNKSHPDIQVNFLEYVELEHGQVRCRFTWITNLTITENNCIDLVRGGRSRWKIENETFNTLKNQGYRLEHNYGHGEQHLSTNFALLMMLAFLMDQIQELASVPFQKARQRFRSRTSLWEHMRALFVGYFIDNWETFWQAIINGHQAARLQPRTVELCNTS